MHPAYIWWKQAQEARHAHCSEHAHEGREHGHRHRGRHGQAFDGWSFGGFGDFGGGLGVRRPLRFLAHKLDLREEQVSELAAILNELKTERAQAEVDDRRTIAGLADAIAGESYDDARAKEAGDIRVKSAESLRQAVTKALGKIHALLDAEQRSRLAYLIRTGVLSL